VIVATSSSQQSQSGQAAEFYYDGARWTLGRTKSDGRSCRPLFMMLRVLPTMSTITIRTPNKGEFIATPLARPEPQVHKGQSSLGPTLRGSTGGA